MNLNFTHYYFSDIKCRYYGYRNVSKAELDYLTNQPTAKALIEKVETEGVYIPEG